MERWLLCVANRPGAADTARATVNSFFDFEAGLLGIVVKVTKAKICIYQQGIRKRTAKGNLARPWWLSNLSKELRAAGLVPHAQIAKI